MLTGPTTQALSIKTSTFEPTLDALVTRQVVVPRR